MSSISQDELPLKIKVKNRKGDYLNYVFPDKSNISYIRDYLIENAPRQSIIYLKGSEKGVVIEKNLDDLLKCLEFHSNLHKMLVQLDEEKIKLVEQYISEMI